MAVTWDPSNKSASVTLSGGNLTATCNASQSATLCRATVSQSAGKFYCEGMSVLNGGGDNGFGICNGTQSMVSNTLWLGHDGNPSNGTGNYNGLQYLNNGSFVPSTPPMGAGFWFGMAVDFTNKKIWWWNPAAAGQTGGEWNGDVIANQSPGANVGGLDMATAHPLTGFGTGTAFFPALDLELLNNQMTANFGATSYQIQTVSSGARFGDLTGFKNWDGTTIGGGGTAVVAPRMRLPRIKRRSMFVKGFRFPKKTVQRKITGQILVRPKPLKRMKRRPFFRPQYNPKDHFPIMYVKGKLVPTVFVGNPPWMYGAGPYGGGPYGAASTWTLFNIQPQVPAAVPEKRNRKVTSFKPRKPFKRVFSPKRWYPIVIGGPIPKPPIAAGLVRKIPRVKVKRIRRWKVIKKRWPLAQFFPDHSGRIAWMYGAGPYGGGPYGSAGQVFVIGPIIPPQPALGANFWGYGGMPYGSGPYGAAGQDLAPPRQPNPLQGGTVPPAGPIRVAQPYVSVVRVKQPALADTRKAAPSLQQVRKNTPPLIK